MQAEKRVLRIPNRPVPHDDDGVQRETQASETQLSIVRRTKLHAGHEGVLHQGCSERGVSAETHFGAPWAGSIDSLPHSSSPNEGAKETHPVTKI